MRLTPSYCKRGKVRSALTIVAGKSGGLCMLVSFVTSQRQSEAPPSVLSKFDCFAFRMFFHQLRN